MNAAALFVAGSLLLPAGPVVVECELLDNGSAWCEDWPEGLEWPFPFPRATELPTAPVTPAPQPAPKPEPASAPEPVAPTPVAPAQPEPVPVQTVPQPTSAPEPEPTPTQEPVAITIPPRPSVVPEPGRFEDVSARGSRVDSPAAVFDGRWVLGGLLLCTVGVGVLVFARRRPVPAGRHRMEGDR